jgi:hypothetical protein
MWALCESGICPWSIARSRQAPRHGGGEGTQRVLSGYSELLSGYSSEYSGTHTVRIRVLSGYLDGPRPRIVCIGTRSRRSPRRASGGPLSRVPSPCFLYDNEHNNHYNHRTIEHRRQRSASHHVAWHGNTSTRTRRRTHAHAHMYTHPCIHALRGHGGALPCASHRTCGALPRERSEHSQSTQSARRVLGHRACGALPCEYSVSTPSTHRALGVLITEYTNGNHRIGPRSRASAIPERERARGEGSGSQEQHQPLLTSHNTKHHTSAR